MRDPESLEPERMLVHAGWIRRLAGSLLADPAAADDAVQDTWLAALRHPPRADRPVQPWLNRVLHNFARQRRRADGHRAEREAEVARVEAQPSAEELVLRAECQRELVDSVLELADPYRSTILLCYYEGLTPADIAALHGVPGSTVRSRLQRGLAELRRRLDAKSGGRREVWASALGPLFPPPALPLVPSEPGGAELRIDPPIEPVSTGAAGAKGVGTMLGTKWIVAAAGALLTGTATWQGALWIQEAGSSAGAPRAGALAPLDPVRAVEPSRAADVESVPRPAGPVSGARGQDSQETRQPVAEAAPRAAFTGMLVDDATDAPLPDYTLRVEDASGRVATVTTDASGRFATPLELEVGDVRVHLVDHAANGDRILHGEHEKKRKDGAREPFPEVVRHVALRHTGEDPQRVDVPVGPTFRLQIANPHQADLQGATAILQGFPYWEPGNAAWTALRPGNPPWVRFGAAAPHHLASRRLSLELRDRTGLFAGTIPVERVEGEHEVRVEVDARAKLDGRVVTTERAPLANQPVVLRVAGEERAERHAKAGRQMAYWATTDADGRFALGWLPPGEYTLNLVLDREEDFGRPVTLAAGESARTFVFEPLADRHDLTGEVRSRTGRFEDMVHVHLRRVVEGAEGELSAASKRVKVRWRDGEEPRVGTFSFEALPAGEYRIVTQTQSFLPIEPAERTVRVPGEPIVLLVDDSAPSRDLTFRARGDAADEDLRELHVRFVLDPEGTPKLRAAETERHRATIPDVPLGVPFAWRVHPRGWQPVWGDDTAFASGDELTVQVSRGWGTALIVTGPGEAPRAGTEVYFDGAHVGTTDARGVLRATAAERPTRIRLEYSVDGEVVSGEVSEVPEYRPVIHVFLGDEPPER